MCITRIQIILVSFIYGLLLDLVFLLNEMLTLQFLLFKSKNKVLLGGKMLHVMNAPGCQ